MKFDEQLAATRTSLEQLEALASKNPDLFEHASLIQVEPQQSKVFIHASRDRSRDWKAFVRQYPQAHWQREGSVVSDAWDYRGNLDGTDICIIGAEKRPEAQPLFAEEAVA